MRILLGMEEPPTAVFCANDLSALGALEAAKEEGYNVPLDLSIAGFDDIDEASHALPPLTTIRQRPDYVGSIIAETLIERFSGRKESTRILLEGSLVIRKSTAPPRPGKLDQVEEQA